MKKRTIWLLLTGSILTTLTFLAGHFFNLTDATRDFLKGFGVAVIIGALILERKFKRPSSHTARSQAT